MIYICVDNEGYMNTGVQRSSTNPFTARGRPPLLWELCCEARPAMPTMPLLMVMHNCEYVANRLDRPSWKTTMPRFEKAIEAAKKGWLTSTCSLPALRVAFPPGKLIEVARKAVETNMVPLWEYEYREGPDSIHPPCGQAPPCPGIPFPHRQVTNTLTTSRLSLSRSRPTARSGCLRSLKKGGRRFPHYQELVEVLCLLGTGTLWFDCLGGWTICLFHMND